MARGKHSEDRRRGWEEVHVQRVLDYHNEHCGTNIVIVGKAEDVYPELEGQKRWDWVCHPEIAVEITNLADELVEQIDKALWRILEQVRDETSGRLPGIFILWADVPEQPLLLKQGRKKLFKEALKDCVCEVAPKLKTKREVDLTSRINRMMRRMSSEVFEVPSLRLTKFDDEGSRLRISSWRSFSACRLEGSYFGAFQGLVRHKNEQLSQAKGKETFLIIVVESSMRADANALEDAFKRLDPSDYCHIDHVYRIEGDRIERIPLPQSSVPDQ